VGDDYFICLNRGTSSHSIAGLTVNSKKGKACQSLKSAVLVALKTIAILAAFVALLMG
jgi:hypothetical protein